MQGIVSGTDYAGKRTSLMLFINGRPVECSPLKRAIEITYTTLLPKAAKPWVFLASLRPQYPSTEPCPEPQKVEVAPWWYTTAALVKKCAWGCGQQHLF